MGLLYRNSLPVGLSVQHVLLVKQYRMPGKGEMVEGKVSVLIKELVETGMLKKPIQQIAQTALPLRPVNFETVAPHVSVTGNYVDWHMWQKRCGH